jgi:hypothetical protein
MGAQLQFTGSSAGVIPREVYASLIAAIMFQIHINQSNILRKVDYLRFSSSAFQLFHYCYPPTQMLNFLSKQSSCSRSCLTDITLLPTVTVPRYFSPCSRYLILSTPSFGEEVKPSVPCRRFAACKRSLNGVEVVISAKLPDILAHSSHFRRWGSLTSWQTWRHLVVKSGNI